MVNRIVFVGLVTCLSQVGSATVKLYGVEWDTGDLFSINTTTAALTRIGTTGVIRMVDIAFAPDGTLYGFDAGTQPKLYKINTTTGASTVVAALGVQQGDFVYEGALTFRNNTAYAMGLTSATTPFLFNINTTSGAITGRVAVQREVDINGWYFEAALNKLVGIDRESERFLTIDPANGAVTDFTAPVGWRVGQVGGVAKFQSAGFLVSAGPGGALPGTNKLYRFNIMGGNPPALTEVGGLTGIGGNGLSGLAIIPEPTTLAALTIGVAAAARRRKIGRKR